MAQEIINVGTSPNDGTGDTLRGAFVKTDNNFTELYSGKENLSNKSTSTSLGTSNTLYPSQNAVKTYVDTQVGSKIGGSGTDNYIPRFNGTNALENSIIFDNGTKVGIGTTSPAGKLSIVDVYYNTFFSDNSSQYGSGLILSGDSGSDQRSWRTFVKNGNGSVALTFEVSTNGTSYGNSPIGLTYAERMRITSSGDLLIGKSSAGYNTAGIQTETTGTRIGITRGTSGECLYLNKINSETGNTLVFYYNGATVGTVSITSSSTSYNTSSDYRLKQDLKPINGLDLISKIKVYDYEWKSDKSRAYGVLAHELQEVIPQAVNGEKDAEQMQGVDYSKLVPILVQSIQELKEEIETLKNK